MSRTGQAPIGQPGQRPAAPPPSVRGGLWVGTRYLPPIRGGESQPGETPVASAQPPATPPPASEPPKPAGDEHDPERARALIDKLRPFEKRSKELERELADARAKLDEHETAKLSETEKLTKRVAELEGQVKDGETVKERADRLAAALTTHLDQQRKDMPKHVLDLLDKLDVVDQLEWVAKHRDEVVGAGGRPGVPATPRANGNPVADKVDENRRRLAASGAYRPL